MKVFADWSLLIALFAVIIVVVYAIYTFYVFLKRPTTEQLTKVKEWLLYAVTKAEKELGSGTGQIKLRYVYDMFVAKFPFLVQVVAFDQFSVLVDESLDKFRAMLNTNAAVKDYVMSSQGGD